jgi:hypothetical protein
MRKTILTTVVALFCLGASAQYSVISSVNEPSEGDSWGLENFTENVGVGYQMNDDIMIGVMQNGDDYDFMARYSLADNMYLSAQVPTENSVDSMTLGVGISISVWGSLYIEPNYTIKDDEGRFNIGLSYKL